MTSAPELKSLVIREIDSVAEIRAVEDLQIEVWGDNERDVVPLNQLAAAHHVGGSLIGAFDGEKIVGFVYGFLGSLKGRIVHHSHMLGVLPEYRNHNLAFRLKVAQREKVLGDKITDRITWTFDPLQSLNAYFNFAKLGVVSDTYKVNVYGESAASFLHRNGTDRFFVTWRIDSDRVAARLAGDTAPIAKADLNAQPLITNSQTEDPVRSDPTELLTADAVFIEIPAYINAIESADFEKAQRWREETRKAFSKALSEGFMVTEYFRENERTGKYLLERKRMTDFI